MRQFFFAQKAFIVHNGRLLLVRKSMNDPNQPGKWEVPGGRMEFGEDVDPHIIREVREEVGIEIKPGRPFYVWQWQLTRQGSGGESIEMQIVAAARICTPITTATSSVGQVTEDYLGEIRWVPLADVMSFNIIPNMIPVMRVFLQEYQP